MLSAPNVGTWGGGGTVESAAAFGQRDLGDGGALMPLGGASFGLCPSTWYPPMMRLVVGETFWVLINNPKTEAFCPSQTGDSEQFQLHTEDYIFPILGTYTYLSDPTPDPAFNLFATGFGPVGTGSGGGGE